MANLKSRKRVGPPEKRTAGPSEISLDLKLAWHRVKLDRPARAFISHPFLFSWIEFDLNRWLNLLRQKLTADYQPHDCLKCPIPKENWMVRPGSVLDIEDEVVYNAVLGSFHGQIWANIGWSQGDPDIAYQFQRPATKPQWINSGFPVWNQCRKSSLAKLKKGIHFVVFADISAFYENIDLGRLSSDLRALNLNSNHIEILSICLKRWSHPRVRSGKKHLFDPL